MNFTAFGFGVSCMSAIFGIAIPNLNFSNPYSVYLHDTNQRSLFGQTSRSLSHGCVRVQEWQKLAEFMIRNDQADSTSLTVPMQDSLYSWLERKEKHSISLKKRVPVYIRYHTAEGSTSGISFYDDIYGEDQQLKKQYFASK